MLCLEGEGDARGSGLEPRYFVVYPDGSGEELLQYEDISRYMGDAENDPSAAMLHGSVEGDAETTTLTVIRPHQGKNKC